MRRKSCVAEKSRHANFAKKLFLRVEAEWSMSKKLLDSLRTALFIFRYPCTRLYCLDSSVIVWLYVSQPRYYVVCTSHTLEASRMTSEDKKGSTQAVQELFGHAPFCFHPQKELFCKICMPTFFSHT